MNWNGLKSSPLDKLWTKTFIFKYRYSVYQVLCDRLVQFEIFCFQPVSSFVVQEVLHYVKQRSGQGKEKVILCVHPSAASWKVILKKMLVCHVFFTFFLWLYNIHIMVVLNGHVCFDSGVNTLDKQNIHISITFSGDSMQLVYCTTEIFMFSI